MTTEGVEYARESETEHSTEEEGWEDQSILPLNGVGEDCEEVAPDGDE